MDRMSMYIINYNCVQTLITRSKSNKFDNICSDLTTEVERACIARLVNENKLKKVSEFE
jgi:hypothetical protein